MLVEQVFENMNHDSQLSRVKVVLVSAECSRTSVADPIELLIQEGQPDSNMSQLLNLKPQGSEKSADALGGRHVATLRTAMSGLIPNSNAIVYLTRSVHSGENEKVITDALKSQKTNSSMKWKLSPPVVMLRPSDIATSTGNYLKIMPSAHENGCFIAVLSRRTGQKDDAKEMVKKAALQGLFNVDALADGGGSANNTPSRQASAGVKKSVSMSKGFGSTANRK
jgi:16S rRNA C967 or C1407 C5-methylase (RsmB/RsmF family)